MQASDAQEQIDRNIAVHNQVAEKYEALHGEIFNEVGQARLATYCGGRTT